MVDAEGKLYFSSNAHAGFGGFDAFSYEIVEQEPVIKNLGKPINSTADDLYFSTNSLGTEGFIVSNRTGSRSFDPQNTTSSDDIYLLRIDRKKPIKTPIKTTMPDTAVVNAKASPDPSKGGEIPVATTNGNVQWDSAPVATRPTVFLTPNGELVNANGERVNLSGQRIDENGKPTTTPVIIATKTTDLVPITDLALLDKSPNNSFNEKGEMINAKGERTDAKGNVINGNVQRVSAPVAARPTLLLTPNGELVNTKGERVNINGQLIDENGKPTATPVIAATNLAQLTPVPANAAIDDKLSVIVNEKGERIDAKGNVQRVSAPVADAPVATVTQALATRPALLITPNGELVNMQGERVNSNGQRIDAQGNLLPPSLGGIEGGVLTTAKTADFTLLTDLALIDKSPNTGINNRGELLNENGERIDAKGNIITAKGNIIDAKNNVTTANVQRLLAAATTTTMQGNDTPTAQTTTKTVLIAANGDLVNEKGQRINANRQLIDNNGNITTTPVLTTANTNDLIRLTDLALLATQANTGINEKGELVNAEGNRIDTKGNVITTVAATNSNAAATNPPVAKSSNEVATNNPNVAKSGNEVATNNPNAAKSGNEVATTTPPVLPPLGAGGGIKGGASLLTNALATRPTLLITPLGELVNARGERVNAEGATIDTQGNITAIPQKVNSDINLTPLAVAVATTIANTVAININAKGELINHRGERIDLKGNVTTAVSPFGKVNTPANAIANNTNDPNPKSAANTAPKWGNQGKPGGKPSAVAGANYNNKTRNSVSADACARATLYDVTDGTAKAVRDIPCANDNNVDFALQPNKSYIFVLEKGGEVLQQRSVVGGAQVRNISPELRWARS